ncbi:Electron transfer flavoprotein beta subunit [Phytophthora nicotianae]|nr:Electron transfer flavoprotein beta subunit [Phytophthora nicotianae]
MLRIIKAKLSRPGIFDDAAALIGEQEYRDRVVEHMLKVRAAILQLFIARFSSLDTNLLWITYLDPRFHKMKLLQTSEVRLAKRCLIDAAVTVVEEQAGQQSTSSSGAPVAAPLRSPSDSTADVWDDVLGDDHCGDVRDASSGFQRTRTRCKTEFEQYLDDAKSVERKQNPLKWWSVNRRKYPVLSPLARKWLGCVATSVPSERAFSTAGNTVTTKRSQLDPSLARDLVFIAENQ